MSAIRVSVEYFAQARLVAGVAREEVSLEVGDMRHLLIELASRHGPKLAEFLSSPAILIAVGDRQIEARENVSLKDRDVVAIIPPISGG